MTTRRAQGRRVIERCAKLGWNCIKTLFLPTLLLRTGKSQLKLIIRVIIAAALYKDIRIAIHTHTIGVSLCWTGLLFFFRLRLLYYLLLLVFSARGAQLIANWSESRDRSLLWLLGEASKSSLWYWASIPLGWLCICMGWEILLFVFSESWSIWLRCEIDG